MLAGIQPTGTVPSSMCRQRLFSGTTRRPRGGATIYVHRHAALEAPSGNAEVPMLDVRLDGECRVIVSG